MREKEITPSPARGFSGIAGACSGGLLLPRFGHDGDKLGHTGILFIMGPRPAYGKLCFPEMSQGVEAEGKDRAHPSGPANYIDHRNHSEPKVVLEPACSNCPEDRIAFYIEPFWKGAEKIASAKVIADKNNLNKIIDTADIWRNSHYSYCGS